MDTQYEITFRADNDWHLQQPHFHDNLEIILSMSSGENFFLDRNAYKLRQGTLIFVSPDTLHRSFSSEQTRYERYMVKYPLATVQALSTPQSDLTALLGQLNSCINLPVDGMEHTVWLLENCLRKNDTAFGGDIRRDIFFMELLLFLCELVNAGKGQKPEYKADFYRIQPLLGYIDAHLSDSLSLDVLSQEFSMNKYYMCHLFKEASGFTIVEYINYCRILKARILLRRGVSVQKAGEQTGFASNAHFIRTYGKITGVSPGQYAKSFRSR